MAAARKGEAAAKPGRQPLDHLSADAQLDPDATVEVGLGDGDDARMIEVAPLRDWRSSGLRALRTGDFDTWADKCLTDEGRQAWLDVDPTLRQIEAFFDRWGQQTGQSLGN